MAEMERRLRWMQENVGGAFDAVHPPGKPGAGDHCVNSGTCILVFCYMEALGKVLMKGSGSCSSRFRKFLETCMPKLATESNSRGFTQPHKLLYGDFRSAFVHGYPKKQFGWGRKAGSPSYWFEKSGRLCLNINTLLNGFDKGIAEFKKCARKDKDLRHNFIAYITK